MVKNLFIRLKNCIIYFLIIIILKREEKSYIGKYIIIMKSQNRLKENLN